MTTEQLKSVYARLTCLCASQEREIHALRERFGTYRRRERLEVAARIMAACATKVRDDWPLEDAVNYSIRAADALIARIDAEEGKS